MEKHVSILIPKGHTSLVNIVGTHQIFNQVNGFLAERGAPPLFKVELVGLSSPTNQTNGLFAVHPQRLISEVIKTDLIILPAIHDPDHEKAFAANQEIVPWMKNQFYLGAEIGCFCVGAFFLARTGLLDGKQCSTHWIHAEDFRKMFPKVDLVDDRILTEDQGIYTSGGAYSYLNLVLYLIEKYAGREIAILTAKAFMIDIEKESQSPFIIFQGQKEHVDESVRKAQDYIEQHFQDKITIQELASMFAISRRSLERRFKKATSNTITQYIQRVKVEAAKRSLENSRDNVNDVMFRVGYSDEKTFRNIFKKFTGISPVMYRSKYNRDFISN